MTPLEIRSLASLDGRTYASAARYRAAVNRLLTRKGFPVIQSATDAAGNCRFCGEGARCPGWHILDALIHNHQAPVTR